MAELALEHVGKVYRNGYEAIHDFSLEIKEGEFLILVGPSGCGKSTLLRMIAGLEDISSGELWVDGEIENYKEPRERNLAMVFQNYALYPNMSVYDNIAFSLSVRKVDKKEIKKKVYDTAKMLGIEHLLDRRPGELSGGQKQRVAIGNAIIRNPRALLMDEPLSNQDAKLRTQMRVELAALQYAVGTTTIYVTHDHDAWHTDCGDAGWKNAAGGYTGEPLCKAGQPVCRRIHRNAVHELFRGTGGFLGGGSGASCRGVPHDAVQGGCSADKQTRKRQRDPWHTPGKHPVGGTGMCKRRGGLRGDDDS